MRVGAAWGGRGVSLSRAIRNQDVLLCHLHQLTLPWQMMSRGPSQP